MSQTSLLTTGTKNREKKNYIFPELEVCLEIEFTGPL